MRRRKLGVLFRTLQVTPLYGCKVIAVPVYPSRDPVNGAARLEGVLRLSGRWHRATAQGQRVALAPAR